MSNTLDVLLKKYEEKNEQEKLIKEEKIKTAKIKKIFYDLETTGLNKQNCSIIQLSGCIELDGEVFENFDFKMRPWDGTEFEPEALKLYERRGITMDEILSYPDPKRTFRDFQELLCRYINKFDKKDKFLLYGYNNKGFDDDFLRNYFLRMDDPYFGSFFYQNTIDVYILGSEYFSELRQSLPNLKLETVAEILQFDVDHELLHDAEYDISLTRLAYKVFKNNPDFKKYTETMKEISYESVFKYHPLFGWDYYPNPLYLSLEEKVKICLERLSSKESPEKISENPVNDKPTDELPF